MSEDLTTVAETTATGDRPADATRAPNPDGLAPGTAVGRYLVIDELGRGGMGVVVRAYDPRLQREVALKLLRTQAMSERARMRMIREARAMAKLNHRNVVAVYDVEIEPRSVMLAMELVQGSTLRRWVEQSHSWTRVIDVMLQAGEGLASAHAAGLLHRDFKPGNVLVADAEPNVTPRVCVTDFGLARASDGSLSDGPPELRSSHSDAVRPDTAADAQLQDSLDVRLSPRDRDVPASREPSDGALTVAGTVVGTPAYMAPEQHRGHTLDAAADQYSFCLVVWEALCGQRPFTAASAKALATAKAAGPPRWPSPVVVPHAIVAAIRRGLHPDPEQRWSAMSALLQALSRARHPPAWRRRLVWLGTAALATTGLLAAVAPWRTDQCTGSEAAFASRWGAQARRAAEHGVLNAALTHGAAVWQQVAPTLDAYAADWRAMHTETCEATVRYATQSTEVMDLRMACIERVGVRFGAVAQRLAQADAEVLANAHVLVEGLPALSQCADVRALTAAVAPPSDTVADEVTRIRAALARADADKVAGKVGDAQSTVEALADAVTATGYAPLHVEWSGLIGSVLSAASQSRRAESHLRDALRQGLSYGQWDEVVHAATGLMQVQRDLARPAEAFAVAETAWGVLPRTSNPEMFEAQLRAQLGALFRYQAKYDAAEAQTRAVIELRTAQLGATHHRVASARSQLGNVLRDRGQYADAEREYEAALRGLSDALGAEHPSVAAAHVSFGSFFARMGKFDQAREHNDAGMKIAVAALGEASHRVGSAYANLGGLLARQGKLEQALAAQQKAIAIWEAELGAFHPDVVMERGNNLAQTLLSLQRFDEAEALARPALERTRAIFGPTHPRVAMVSMCLAGILSRTDRADQAEALVRDALASRLAALGSEHMLVAHTRLNLGANLVQQDRWAEAEPVIATALAALIAAVGENHPTVGTARSNLAEVLLALDRPEPAAAMLRGAVRSLTATLGPDAGPTVRARQRLAELNTTVAATTSP